MVKKRNTPQPEGDLICKKCGQIMYQDPNGTNIWTCSSCGWKAIYFVHTGDSYSEKESKSDAPAGCRACGGPYPLCKDSCALFD